MQSAREQIEQRGAERYEQYRLFEEKTDIGERLSLPIENRLKLEIIDGKVYGRTVDGERRRMTDWSRESLQAALDDPGFAGANAVERVRRHHEYEEAVAVEALQPGEVMTVLSPIPDAALEGRLSITGYRTDLARTFCRLYYRDVTHVTAVTLSLEQSNKRALRAMAEQLHWALPQAMGSEEVLASRHVMTADEEQFAALPDQLRYHYDQSLHEQTGQVFFAGNRLAGRRDSMRFINDNHDLIDEHMSVLRSIEARITAGSQRDAELESLRQRTAAALDYRLHGGSVSSLSDAEVGVQLSMNDYGGECATGTSTQMSSTEQMGLAQGKHITNCPLCGTKGVTATVEGETITCSDCRGSVDICSGKVTHGRPQRRTAETYQATPSKQQPRKTASKEAVLSAKYGEKVTIKRHKVIGGEEQLVLNVRGEVLQRAV